MTSVPGLTAACAVAVAIFSVAPATVVRAAPPTVQPSPGYDRALVDSRRTRVETPVVVETPPFRPHRRKVRRH